MNAPSIISQEFIISFPCLLEARAMKNPDGTDAGKKKFSCTAVFPVGQPQKYIEGVVDITNLRKAAMEVAKAKFGDKLPALIKGGKFKNPFLSNEEDMEKYGWPEGSVCLRLTSISRPGVVSCYKGPDGKPLKMTDAEIAEKLYPGARCRASIRPFAYDMKLNKGVSFAFNNLQWLGDDERLDGRSNAQDEFEPTADASDLETGDTPEAEETETPAKTQAAPSRPAAPADLAKAKGTKGKVDLSDLL